MNTKVTKQHWWSIEPGLLLVVAWFSLALSGGATRPALAEQGQNHYFPQTGHSVSGQFLSYWQSNGGLAIFGYPLTDAEQEIDPATGKSYLTQWFERNTFQLHPEYANTAYEVELGLLGNQLTAQRRANGETPFQPVGDAHYADGSYFAATGHNLRNSFEAYWLSHGGLTIFGYPTSEEFQEVNPDDGQTYLVQYFERNRFEYHEALRGTPYEVELGLLGKQLVSTRRASQSDNLSTLTQQAQVTDLTVDRGGAIYITDSQYHRVQKFAANGQRLAVWGNFGTGDGQFYVPAAVAVDKQGQVYVADSYNQRIQKFSAGGQFLSKFGSRGSGNGQFKRPTGVAIDALGNIYVADTDNHRIQKFDANGQFLTQWGSLGSGNGQFGPPIHGLNIAGPHYLSVDGQGNVYATDDGNSRTQKFDSNGHFVLSLSTQYPGGMAVDNQNHVYILLQRSLLKFDSNGQLLNTIGDPTSDNGLRNGTSGFATDSVGSVFYIASTSDNRVYRLPQG